MRVMEKSTLEPRDFGENQVPTYIKYISYKTFHFFFHRFFVTKGQEPYMKLPVTPGHEFSGRVVALGEGSKGHHGVDVGDLVVSEQIVACGLCRFCKNGNYQVCPDHTVYGFQRETNGAMAGYMIFPEKARVHKIPEGVPPHHATFVEPLGLYIVLFCI